MSENSAISCCKKQEKRDGTEKQTIEKENTCKNSDGVTSKQELLASEASIEINNEKDEAQETPIEVIGTKRTLAEKETSEQPCDKKQKLN